MGLTLRVAIDVGGKQHRVGIADPEGRILEEFVIPHTQEGFREFFSRVERHRRRLGVPVAVAMEGYNGHARPLDRLIQEKGYTLYNVNNLKLARFREIFPGAAKTDKLDTRRILELFHLKDHLPLAKDVLQEVSPIPRENERLKRLSRRRRQLVEEKVRVVERMQADLRAVCPELLGLTTRVDNLWFLRFLTFRADLRDLAELKPEEIRGIPGIGKKYAGIIGEWQEGAKFSPEVEYVGPMIISDAKRVLELLEEIGALEEEVEELSQRSELAQRLSTIPGFGRTSVAELAGEIGTLERFRGEASLALYLGMCPLDRQSGQYHGTRTPRQVNRRAKAAMMAAVAHHIRMVPESRAYYEKKRAEGKGHNQAVRALGRHLVRVIWSMLRQGRDYELREAPCPT
ncbi:IS110 family RNA-guided transposase [Candidatus Bipolaricaulota sp. J31]